MIKILDYDAVYFEG